jgi:hypothetical protein
MPEQINGTMKGYHVYLGKIDTQMKQLKIEFSLLSVQLDDICSRTCVIRHLSFPDQKLRVGWIMVFNATFNNISVISWRSVLLVEETGLILKPINKYIHIFHK